ncbi:MAG: ECF-type sigma factor [Gemmatimonadota bacterium]|nr:sigma-70 family RNA polymerase sigma factor [Gemmatimonadota bacterium]
MTSGSPEVDRLFSMAYEELRRLAGSLQQRTPTETLRPTALVNEAYLKLARSPELRPESVLHFKRIAARAMRQVLVEAARRRSALKRGGDVALVTFDESTAGALSDADDVIALDHALEELSALSARQADIVECRFFAGFDVAETAEILRVSKSTVEREWRAARAWLAVELRSRA